MEVEPAPVGTTQLALKVGDQAQAQRAGWPHASYSDPGLSKAARSLAGFDEFRDAVASLPLVADYYGEAAADQLALAWVFSSTAAGDISGLWADFWDRLCTPTWTYVAVARLLNFETDCGDLVIAPGLTVRAITMETAADALGWSADRVLSEVGDGWRGTRWDRSFVVHSITVPKTPSNFELSNSGQETAAIARFLRAVRLSLPGDVTASTIICGRTRSVLPEAGYLTIGIAGDGNGNEICHLSDDDVELVRDSYERLGRFEPMARQYQQIERALARLCRYDEYSSRMLPDRLIDDFVALEALVGSDTELTYKLAIRVSGVLAETDKERVALFERIRSFYDIRSKLVHGKTLTAARQQQLLSEPELRDIARRLLLGFVRLTESPEFEPRDDFAEKRLDAILLDGENRATLRAAIGVLPPRVGPHIVEGGPGRVVPAGLY